jgi:23S rRNA (guanosine2251-2'-O)-methyltransferase
MAETIVGRKPILEALKAGTAIEKIAVLPGLQGRLIEEIRTLAEKQNIPVQELDHQRFRTLAGNMKTQGMIAVLAHSYTYPTIEAILARAASRSERPFLLILDEIEDPHNLGALIRTAECAGAHGVIVPKHRSAPISATVTKTSAGATAHIPIALVTNIVTTIDDLKKEGLWITGLDAAGEKLYTQVEYTGPTALVVGNEGRGIRRLVKEHCDFLVRIPLLGKIASLNASVAGAIVMYEVVRQRGG